jgi:predicted O-methyltransferase YrrM
MLQTDSSSSANLPVSKPSVASQKTGVDCRSVFRGHGTQWLEPVQISAATVLRRATSAKTLAEVRAVMEQLTGDDYLEFLKSYYDTGIRNFAGDWYYADLLTFLHAAASLIQPRSYLEIGVRRGRSLAMVSAVAPTCGIAGFDMWMPDYAGMPNPGPDFVTNELAQLGHQGPLELISGDSHETVPKFFDEYPDTRFDLINVDGDHSEDGARADLVTVLPRLAVGGVIVLDDITHPQHEYLETVWDEVIGTDSRFSSAKYRDLGYGVAVAVRKRD